MTDFDELDKIYELAKKSSEGRYNINGEITRFIIDKGLAGDIDIEFGDGKIKMEIKYRDVVLVYEDRIRPFSEIRKRLVH